MSCQDCEKLLDETKHLREIIHLRDLELEDLKLKLNRIEQNLAIVAQDHIEEEVNVGDK